jgi:CheY-like chemotaxis protein
MAEVMLIDDMEGVRNTIATMLRRGGHSVTAVNSGFKGIELLKTKHFDIVVTDVLMEDGDGTDVVMFLDGMRNRPRVVAISGGDRRLSPDVALLLARMKADAILTKPFEHAELTSTIARLLGQAGGAST